MAQPDESKITRALEHVLAPVDRQHRRDNTGCLVSLLFPPAIYLLCTGVFQVRWWLALLAAVGGWALFLGWWFSAPDVHLQTSVQRFERRFRAGTPEWREAVEILENMSDRTDPSYKQSAEQLLAALGPIDKTGEAWTDRVTSPGTTPRARRSGSGSGRSRVIPLQPEPRSDEHD